MSPHPPFAQAGEISTSYERPPEQGKTWCPVVTEVMHPVGFGAVAAIRTFPDDARDVEARHKVGRPPAGARAASRSLAVAA